jgi:hypothetical protein
MVHLHLFDKLNYFTKINLGFFNFFQNKLTTTKMFSREKAENKGIPGKE